MNAHAILAWLQDTSFATAVRENGFIFPWVECAHVVSLTLVVGTIAVVDLRLLGIASLSRPVRSLMKQMLPYTWMAFGIALLTGLTLVSSNAVAYLDNTQFRLKFLAMALAGANMLVFHVWTCRGLSRWNESPAIPWNAKLAGGVSVLLWVTVVALGRWIAFTMPLD